MESPSRTPDDAPRHGTVFALDEKRYSFPIFGARGIPGKELDFSFTSSSLTLPSKEDTLR